MTQRRRDAGEGGLVGAHRTRQGVTRHTLDP